MIARILLAASLIGWAYTYYTLDQERQEHIKFTIEVIRALEDMKNGKSNPVHRNNGAGKPVSEPLYFAGIAGYR